MLRVAELLGLREVVRERALIGRRVDIPRVTDEPVGEQQGQTYVVESQLEESKAAPTRGGISQPGHHRQHADLEW
jgi:hypothetical protein